MKFRAKQFLPAMPALRSRNYRLFFFGQGISLIGNWMTLTATIWLVYHLTNSALMLGIVGFASQFPNFVLTPFAGVLVDQWNRHKTIIVTQVLAMIQSLTLATLALTNSIQIWQIIVLSICQGCINAFDMPARQAFVVKMVDRKEDLGNAIALNSSIFSGARLIGPAIAGIVIAAVGTGTCFLIDGVSYIAVIAGLLAMKLPPLPGGIPKSSNTILQQLKEGFDYAFGFPPIRSILLLIALVSFVGMPYTTLAPIFAREILHGGPETLGFLMAAAGLGALLSAGYLSTRPSVLGLTKLIAIAPAIFGAALITFAFSRVLWLSLLAMLVLGMSLILQHTSGNTVLQTIVDEDKRGRVLSFYLMAFTSMVTFGNLLAGTLASWIGAPDTLTIGGVLCIAGSLAFIRQLPSMRNHIRPIYRRIGVLPQTPT
ncbi:MFS transporter [Kovacikia minuta CCNUW1]|uniref:MFS transporter n=1 Tax=Kovacikia minuta TaxID=2931930 RepID=UPI001CCE618F|nr:MFS transporter [Kovacikia minuta]UBF29369.1 MFS transporter [Kovacikia minuta CCNUW1]